MGAGGYSVTLEDGHSVSHRGRWVWSEERCRAQGHPVPSGGEGSVGAAARSALVRSSWSEQIHRLSGRSCPEGHGLNVESRVQRAHGLGEGVCHKPDDWGEWPWPWGMGCFLNRLTPNLVSSVRLMTSCEVFRDTVGCHPTGLGFCLWVTWTTAGKQLQSPSIQDSSCPHLGQS